MGGLTWLKTARTCSIEGVNVGKVRWGWLTRIIRVPTSLGGAGGEEGELGKRPRRTITSIEERPMERPAAVASEFFGVEKKEKEVGRLPKRGCGQIKGR